ncbi:unnamed protein product [Alopecurus aequalis]
MEEEQSYLGLLKLSNSEPLPESPVGEQVTPPTQEPSASVKAKFIKGKNWSSEEDKVLIQAWANTSLDAVPGSDQHSTSYWGRISEYYNTHKNSSWPERNANALSCRYNTISSKTSKYCECVRMTDQERPEEAHLLYLAKDPKKKPFTLMHCYLEFEKYPKWQTHLVSQKKQKKTSDASPGTTSNDDDFRACTYDLETEQRSLGMNHEKERLQRDKASASDGSGSRLLLETLWAQKLEKDEIKEAMKSARYARAFELQEKQIALQEREIARQERKEARKQLEFEEKIMSMDTSGMSVGQKKFYKDKQEEIIARRSNSLG